MTKKISILLLFFYLIFQPVLAENNALKIGSDRAKLTIKVFSSLTCPHCANFHNNIFEDLQKEYINNSKVKFEHHGFPLDLAALNAEKIVRCTTNIKIRFNLLSEIYKKQSIWAVGSDINIINDSLKKIGLTFGLNEKQLNKCLEDEKVQDQILNERIDAQKNYKISSTPTIFINEKKYEGKHDFDSFKKTLNKLL
ncbi:MAG: DsbA family protein [Pelagibacteraceae bacterium]